MGRRLSSRFNCSRHAVLSRVASALQCNELVYVAGAVRHEDFGYFREQILEHLVLEGAHYDDLVDDHEFTDRKAVGEAMQQFLET